MKKIYLLCAVATLGLLASCGSKDNVDHDREGMAMLAQARQLLADGQAEAARDTIQSMRKLHPTAIEARRQAILTLDSAELAIAENEGDSLKIEFYTRKIDHDKNSLQPQEL